MQKNHQPSKIITNSEPQTKGPGIIERIDSLWNKIPPDIQQYIGGAVLGLTIVGVSVALLATGTVTAHEIVEFASKTEILLRV
ncbi:MAG: hypothetical protein M1158_01735 [Candidatus Marsarchaeota archaeon]|nr:hypothetical protein [Candidatus Marsarchaeota archaeon]